MSESQDAWRPGEQLRKLREEANISLDSIAKETLIPFNKLQCLEADEYSKIGKPVFVIAYIRKYAKSLGINSDPFVEQLKLHTGVENSEVGIAVDARETTKRFKAPKIPALVLIPALILLWLLSAWFLKDEPEDVLPVSAPSPAETVVDRPAAEAESGTSKAPTNPDIDQPAAPESTDSPLSEFSEPEIVEEQEVEEQEDSVEAYIDEPAETTTSVGEGDDILVISFFEECWVEVKDANGAVIFAQLQNAGDNLRLSGEAPFNVMLGNARGVDLLVNGRRISTEPPAGRRTLKFDVGP